MAAELAQARRENARLQQRLERAEAIIDLQKKVASLLGIALRSERQRRQILMDAVLALPPAAGLTAAACAALGAVARYRLSPPCPSG